MNILYNLFKTLFVIVITIVNLDPSTLVPSNQAYCQASQTFTFGISNIGEQAPEEIVVKYSTGELVSENVRLERIYDNTAYYSTKRDNTYTVEDAEAVVPDDWSGKFGLLCNRPTAVDVTNFSAKSDYNALVYGSSGILIGVLVAVIIAFVRMRIERNVRT